MSYIIEEEDYLCDEVRDRDRDRDRDRGRDRGKCRRKDTDCCIYPKHPLPKKIMLECGCNPQDAIFEIDDERVERNQEFVLDRVVVDTSCLCRPQIKIEFSCLVFFEAEAENGSDKELEVDLLFELIRICNGVEQCVQNWRYLKEFEIERDDDLEVEISEPFTVTYCDKVCSGCCEYIMIVKGKDFDGDFDALRVTKPDISALAQGLCDD